MLRAMESPASPADELPALYRAILDGLAPLEQSALRREALLIRTRASKIYAQSWSGDGRKRLQSLLRRIERLSARNERAAGLLDRPGDDRPRWRLLRRPVATR
jgi:hypothetical protein